MKNSVMPDSRVPIVVVAYNRPRSLIRLLKSLAKANYPSNDIPLIISIDNADTNNDVLQIANDFIWNFGPKEVKYQKVNLGLRKHVLKCGSISQKYGAVIILEDDLYVSINFYNYAQSALKFSADKDYIGGISLYNHQLNVHTRDNFTAFEDRYDNWYFQFASSWGQAWSKNQWVAFSEWYQENKILQSNSTIPRNVTQWSDQSWLKYYIAHLIETKKYFLYPKISLTTNFSDAGTHVGEDSTAFQVPLYFNKKKGFNFSTLQDSNSVYDAFFENVNIYKNLGYSKASICIDLYAYKDKPKERYWLTTQFLNYKIIKSFGRSLRPIDANIVEDIIGKDIYLYDTELIADNNPKIKSNRKTTYNIKYISYKTAVGVVLDQTLSKIKNLINKFAKSSR